MLIEKKKTALPAGQWPDNYYQEDDPQVRKELLDGVLRNSPSEDDLRRNEILKRRYRKNDDLFMEAWLMINMCEQDHIGILNRKRKEREFLKYAEQLMVSGSPDPVLCLEWKAFAEKWIRTCLSRQYRSAGFGVISMRDEAVAGKIAREINTVTRDIPRRFSKEDSFLPLRKILIEVYKHEIADSDDIFNV